MSLKGLLKENCPTSPALAFLKTGMCEGKWGELESHIQNYTMVSELYSVENGI